MIRLPLIEHAVERGLIVEIAIAPIDRQLGRRDGDQHRTRTPGDHLVTLARRDDDHLMSEARGRPQLRIDIGPNATACRRIKCTHVDGIRMALDNSVGADEAQVKLC